MSISWLMAVRYLSRRKLRTFLTTLSVIFGVMIIFGLNSILIPMINALRSDMMIAAGKVDLTVTQTIGSTFSPQRVSDIASVPGIQQVSGLLKQNVLLPLSLGGSNDPASGLTTLTVVGLDPQSAQTVRSYAMIEGRFLRTGESGSVVVSQTVANKLKLRVGDRLTLPAANGTRAFTVVGILQLYSSSADEAFMTLPAAQELLNRPDQINTMEVLLAVNSDHSIVEQAVMQKLGANFKLGGTEVGQELLASVNVAQAAFNLFGLFSLIMGAFIIFNTFRTVVAERRHDLGMLRALGAGRGTVISIFLTESLIQGVVGTALGLLAGYGLALITLASVSSLLVQFVRVRLGSPEISLQALLGTILLGLGLTIASALLPAFSAAQITPIEALRPVPGRSMDRTYRRQAWIGFGLSLLAVLMLLTGSLTWVLVGTGIFLLALVLVTPAIVRPVTKIFGRPLNLLFTREGNLAQGNMVRQPGRAAITASAMMIALSLVVSLFGVMASLRASFLTYLDRSLGASYLFLPGSLMLNGGNLGAGPQLAEQLRQVPGIRAVTTLRLATTTEHGRSLQVIGIDPSTFPTVSGLVFNSGVPDQAYREVATSRSAIVNGILAAQYHIKVGDTLILKTADGEQPYHVVGIGLEYLDAKFASAYISQANLEADFHQNADLLLMADRGSDADPAKTLAAMKALAEQYPSFSLIDSTSFRADQARLLEGAMIILYILMVALSVPALIAMINTLTINVMERRREIGLLRAVGATRRQVSRMLLAESLLLAALGTSLGILSGIWLAYAFVNALNASGFVVQYIFPAQGLLAALSVGLLFGLWAASLPVRQAAGLPVVEALKYE
jgi:putative ABC transport system permease protein